MKIEQFATSSKASVDTLFGLAGQAFQGAEQLMALNLKTVKSMLAETQDSSYQALSVKSPAELVTLQTTAMQAAPQKALAYGKEVQAILTTMTATHRSAFEAQVAEVQAKFLETVDGAMKNAPGGDKVIALAKSAVSTANTAYEGANKAGKQVSDAMIENVTKATKAVKVKA